MFVTSFTAGSSLTCTAHVVGLPTIYVHMQDWQDSAVMAGAHKQPVCKVIPRAPTPGSGCRRAEAAAWTRRVWAAVQQHCSVTQFMARKHLGGPWDRLWLHEVTVDVLLNCVLLNAHHGQIKSNGGLYSRDSKYMWRCKALRLTKTKCCSSACPQQTNIISTRLLPALAPGSDDADASHPARCLCPSTAAPATLHLAHFQRPQTQTQ